MEIAARIQDEYGGDLPAGLAEPLSKVRQALKRFPNIADPGADRILLFGGIAPVPAVPSNCPHVLVRIQRGQERENYGVTYREAQGGDRSGNPKEFRRQDARLPVSQAARPDRLQTQQSRMRIVPSALPVLSSPANTAAVPLPFDCGADGLLTPDHARVARRSPICRGRRNQKSKPLALIFPVSGQSLPVRGHVVNGVLRMAVNVYLAPQVRTQA